MPASAGAENSNIAFQSPPQGHGFVSFCLKGLFCLLSTREMHCAFNMPLLDHSPE
jgi:hypothetical protein